MFRSLIPFALACWPLVAVAEVRAVLVGVGDYLYLDADLRGPVNDVGLMAETLMQRGVAAPQITALADPEANLPEGVNRGLPDRNAILAALGGAIDASEGGDTVVFYFSGHGAQAPDTNGDEGGGFDEIFLPRDTRGWDGGIGAVENAILDDELSVFTERAAARGVALVAVIDACHSGTGFRALDKADAIARYVAPSQLGLPEPEADAQNTGTAAPPPGDFVFLYAAQADERAFEYPVGEERLWHGDFTRALTSVMREVPDISYAALVQAATLRMRQTAGQVVQTPDLEGPLADSAVLGGDAPGLARIGVAGQTLDAGTLRGVTEGSVVTLYPDLLSDQAAGTARVTAVRATEADLEYLAPFPTVRVSAAEITDRAVDATVRLRMSEGAKARLGAPEKLSLWLDIPLDAGDPTHLLVLEEDGFALTGPDSILDPAGPGSSIRIRTGSLEAVATRLATAVGRLRVEKALAQMGQGGTGTTAFALGGGGPTVRLSLSEGRTRNGRCAAPSQKTRDVSGRAAAGNCDVLSVAFENTSARMQDVTILYINDDSTIDTLWPRRNVSNRIEVGGSQRMQFMLQADSDRPLHEALIVVAVPAEPGEMRTRLAFLDGNGAQVGAAGPLADYMSAITTPGNTRSFSLTPKAPALSVSRLDLTLTPVSKETD